MIDLGPNDRWEVGFSESSCPPQVKEGMIKPVVIVGALINFNLIQPQFVGKKLIRCLRTINQPVNTTLTIFIICLLKKDILDI